MSLSAITSENQTDTPIFSNSVPYSENQMPVVNIPIITSIPPSPLTNRLFSLTSSKTSSSSIYQKTIDPQSDYSPLTVAEIHRLENPLMQGRYQALYHEITRRIDREELVKLETQMKVLNLEAHEKFLKLVQSGNPAEIAGIEDYPLHALYALQQGHLAEALKKEDSSEISDVAIQDAFATLVMPWASKDDEKACIPLFDDTGETNVLARLLIQETLTLKMGSIFSEKELDLFFEDMAKLPKLQQHFWLEKNRHDNSSLIDVREGIRHNYRGLNVFSETSNMGLMIPSAGMMQTFLKRKFGKNAVRMNFVLGVSSLQDIRNNGTTDTRDAGLRFPQTTFPNTADGFAALQTDFLYHDFFHAIIVSLSTPETRKLIIYLSDFIKPLKNENHVLCDLYAHLIDMETSNNFLKITKDIVPSATLSDFFDYSLGSLISLTPSLFYTCAIALAIVKVTFEHSPLYAQDILQIPQFLSLLIIALVKSFVVSIVRLSNPYKRMRKSEKNAIHDLQEDLQQMQNTTKDPKRVTRITQELCSLEKKTHPLQMRQM